MEQLHLNTKVRKNKIRWADTDDSDEEDLQWRADTTQLTIAELSCEEPTNIEECTFEDVDIEFFDDVTGKKMNIEKATKTRQNELDELDRLNVHDVTDLSECWKLTGRAPISARPHESCVPRWPEKSRASTDETTVKNCSQRPRLGRRSRS